MSSRTATQVKIDREVDLRGEVCPYTFVKTKLVLEDMEVGQVLKALFDHQPAKENVPRSLTNEGHEVIEVKDVSDVEFYIIVRKGRS